MDDEPRAEAVYLLNLFNETAAKLDESRWLQSMRDGKGSYNISWRKGEGTTVTDDMPHREEIKAFVVDYRLFFEQRESFSFRRLKTLYPRLDCVSPELRAQALDLIERVNVYLDDMTPGRKTLIMNREPVSRRHVQQVYLFGGLMHSNNRAYKETMDTWRARRDLEVMIESHFADIALDITEKAIFKMRGLNLSALAQLAEKAA